MADIVEYDRFYQLKEHAEQTRLWLSQARFNLVHAGRRSGKTEITGKRKVVINALNGSKYPDPKFFCGAPTRDQAKRIYWKDLKLMTRDLWADTPSESHLIIPLINGAEIHVLGMDKPERIEGTPWDGGVLDEYGNMKKETWGEHVRPALADRGGWCDFIGVPEGRNHYFDLTETAQKRKAEAIKKGHPIIWDVFWWKSADILDPEEIRQAKEDLDELTYQQEYEGSFVNFEGQAYYAFFRDVHVGRLVYNRKMPLLFMFDFNVSPGCAVVGQEQYLPTSKNYGTGLIDEVHIERNSTVLKVCDQLIKKYPKHEGPIICYGDATGGAGGPAKIMGSEWQLIKGKLMGYYGGKRVSFRVPRENPREKNRVASVNSRLLSYDGKVKMIVDGNKCHYTIKDFEGVRLKDDGSGALDKSDIALSHLTDAIGYYIWREFPLKKVYEPSNQKYWK